MAERREHHHHHHQHHHTAEDGAAHDGHTHTRVRSHSTSSGECPPPSTSEREVDDGHHHHHDAVVGPADVQLVPQHQRETLETPTGASAPAVRPAQSVQSFGDRFVAFFSADNAYGPNVDVDELIAARGDDWDGLEAGERSRMVVLMRILFVIGALQFLAAVAATVVIRVFQGIGGCLNPADFSIPYDFERFKRTGDMCYLGYGLLLTFSWAPQVPMVFSAPLNIIGGFTHYWYLSLGGIALHSLITLGMIGILLAILITGWPFWTYVLPFIIFTILSGLGIPLLVMLSFPWKKMKLIMDRKYERERRSRQIVG